MMASLFLSALSAAGFLVLTRFWGMTEPPFNRAALAIPLGLGVFGVCSAIALLAGGGFILSLALILTAFAGMMGLTIDRNPESLGQALGQTALFAVALGSVCLGAELLIQPVISYDSLVKLAYAWNLHDASLRSESLQGLASWGYLLISLQALAHVLESARYLVGLHALIILATMLLVVWNVRMLASHLPGPDRMLLTLGITGIWGSTYFVLFNAAYIHNAALTAVFVLAMAGTLLRVFVQQDGRGAVICLVVFGIALALSRTEAPLYAAAIITLAAIFLGRPPRSIAII